MIEKQVFRKMDDTREHVNLVWIDNEVEIDRVDLGANFATARQRKNGTEVYVLNFIALGRRKVTLTGKPGFRQYFRESNERARVLSYSNDRNVLYAHLFLYAQYCAGKVKRRNLFKQGESILGSTDPIECLMKTMGY